MILDENSDMTLSVTKKKNKTIFIASKETFLDEQQTKIAKCYTHIVSV